jgi:hypothetical protein
MANQPRGDRIPNRRRPSSPEIIAFSSCPSLPIGPNRWT